MGEGGGDGLVEAVARVVALGVELVLVIDVAVVLAARRRGRWLWR